MTLIRGSNVDILNILQIISNVMKQYLTVSVIAVIALTVIGTTILLAVQSSYGTETSKVEKGAGGINRYAISSLM
jgi:hypothetical protein